MRIIIIASPIRHKNLPIGDLHSKAKVSSLNKYTTEHEFVLEHAPTPFKVGVVYAVGRTKKTPGPSATQTDSGFVKLHSGSSPARPNGVPIPHDVMKYVDKNPQNPA